LFLNRAFHTHQSDTELVFEQFADSTDAPIAKVVDVIDLPYVLAQLQQVTDDTVEVVLFKDAMFERGRKIEFDVELQPPDAREVILPRIKEHTLEKRGRGFKRRRVAWTELAIDFDQGFLCCLDRVFLERLAEDNADVVALREEHGDFGNSDIDNRPNHG